MGGGLEKWKGYVVDVQGRRFIRDRNVKEIAHAEKDFVLIRPHESSQLSTDCKLGQLTNVSSLSDSSSEIV